MSEEDRGPNADERGIPHGAQDDIAALVRLGGRRPVVPPDRMARAREAVHARWQEAVSRRRRRLRLAWVAAAAAAAVLALAVSLRTGIIGGSPAPAPGNLWVDSIQGPAWMDDGEGKGRAALTDGSVIRPGSLLTTGEDGRLSLRDASSHSVRVDSASRVRLVDWSTLELDHGGLYVDSGGAAAFRVEESLSVRTPLGTLREVGTQYEVRLDNGSLRVRVREGRVELHDRSGVHPVARARELTVGADGLVSLAESPTAGPQWEWTQEVATLPDFSGRTARAFLDWVAREQGRELRFADEELARSADRTVLGGALGRLRLSEALDVVLPACGLSYRIEGETLLILPAQSKS